MLETARRAPLLPDMTFPYMDYAQGKRIITIDAEFYYDKDYTLNMQKKVGKDYLDFFSDERFDLLTVAVCEGHNPAYQVSATDFPRVVRELQLERGDTILVAHNARVEATLLAVQYGVVATNVACTMCMARASGASRLFRANLESLGRHVLGGEKNLAPAWEHLIHDGILEQAYALYTQIGDLERFNAEVAKQLPTFDASMGVLFYGLGHSLQDERTFPIANAHQALDWRYGSGVGQNLAKKALGAVRFGRKHKTIVDAMEGKRLADLHPHELQLYNRYVVSDTEASRDLFYEFAPQISYREGRMIQLTMDMYIKPEMRIDAELAKKAKREAEVERDHKIRMALEASGIDCTPDEFAKLLRSRHKFPEMFFPMIGMPCPPVDTPEQRKDFNRALYEQVRAYNMNSPKVRLPEVIILERGKYSTNMGKDSTLNDYVVEHFARGTKARTIWEAKLEVSSTIEITRLQRFIDKGEQHDKFGAPLEYGSAFTLRFGGADKLNLQNLGQDSALREAIQALQGHLLVATDSSQVEPRLQGFICDDQTMLDVFRSGRCIYMYTAAGIVGRSFEELEAMPHDDPDRKRIRNIGKVARLSLGYAMGAESLGRRGELWGIEFAPTIEEHYEEAKRITRAFRKDNPAITGMWKQLEKAMADSIDGYETYLGGADGRLMHVHPATFYGHKVTFIEMPGVRLVYDNLRWGWDERFERHQMMYDRVGTGGAVSSESIYGGKLLENVTQALAACVIKEQGIAAADLGYRLLFNIHDENVTTTPMEHLEKTVVDNVITMHRSPVWAPDLPLEAEASIGVSFKGKYDFSLTSGLEEKRNGESI